MENTLLFITNVVAIAVVLLIMKAGVNRNSNYHVVLGSLLGISTVVSCGFLLGSEHANARAEGLRLERAFILPRTEDFEIKYKYVLKH